ncbi:chorismate-binding protein [Aquimarina sp. AU119]|uniref:chorismate-binding protein n=1 Tax=Aquimarina sp. AU119 TaxID=2108528 RepID=UPI000D69547B|nr:chorismate-binding protein [Aquimarina sp. AU119]
MSIDNVYTDLKKQLKAELPFVIYRKANTQEIDVFLQEDDELYEYKDNTISGFVFAPFNTLEKTVLIPMDKSICYTVTITSPTNIDKNENDVKYDSVLVSSAKEEHMQLVRRGIDGIKAKCFKKVVLSRKEEVVCENNDALEIYKRLVMNYPKAFVYCWYHPKIGMWLGATPETLLHVKENNFYTMALAGTQPYLGEMNVEWGDKEIEEQKMVTDFILDELTPVSKRIESSNVYTYRAGTLLHLRTDIKVVLKTASSDIAKVIQIVHPTPAVCGLPKKDAKSFILEYEGYDRKYYTGFLGELNVNKNGKIESSLFVNLRCMEMKPDKAILYVGGGITKDSEPEKEWEETVKKTETMKKVLF